MSTVLVIVAVVLAVVLALVLLDAGRTRRERRADHRTAADRRHAHERLIEEAELRRRHEETEYRRRASRRQVEEQRAAEHDRQVRAAVPAALRAPATTFAGLLRQRLDQLRD